MQLVRPRLQRCGQRDRVSLPRSARRVVRRPCDGCDVLPAGLRHGCLIELGTSPPHTQPPAPPAPATPQPLRRHLRCVAVHLRQLQVRCARVDPGDRRRGPGAGPGHLRCVAEGLRLLHMPQLLRHGGLPTLLLCCTTRMCWPVMTGLPSSHLVFAGYKIMRVLGKAGGLVARVAQPESCACCALLCTLCAATCG